MARLRAADICERELTGEPLAGPAAGSLVLHVRSSWIAGVLRLDDGAVSSQLLGQPGAGGAMQVSLEATRFRCPPQP